MQFESGRYNEALAAYKQAYTLEPAVQAYRYFYGESGRLAGQPVELPPLASTEPPSSETAPTETAPTETASPVAPPVETAPTEAVTPSTPAPDTTDTATAQAPAAPPTPAPVEPTPPVVAPPTPTPPTPAPALPVQAAAPAPKPAPESSGGPALVLLDVTRTFGTASTADNGAVSFFKSASNLSQNLKAPVNYAGGTLYQRAEVLEKPGGDPVHLQVCLVPNDDISVKPTCSDASTLSFSSTGPVEDEQSLTSFTQYDAVDWSRGVSNLMVIVKDANGNPIDPGYADFSEADLARYYPLKIRYSAVLVPAGGRFPGWPQ